MRLPTKKELGARLVYHPFLRLLLFERWFRVAFLGCLLLAIGLGLFLSRIWPGSPPGFRPATRISGLDWLQARALARTARRGDAQGRLADAAFAWRAAIASNPADAALFRGSLRNFLHRDPPQAECQIALAEALWLLRLSATNHADLALAARVCAKLDRDDWVVELLAPHQEALQPPVETLYLKALFHTGQLKRFIDRWNHLRGSLETEPELALYHAAWLAGWGPRETISQGQRCLEKSLASRAAGVPAARLQVMVSRRQHDLAGCQRALARLRSWNADRLGDHLPFWELLAERGRRAEAGKLAKRCTRPPRTSRQALRMAALLAALGRPEEAIDFLRRQTARLRPAAPLWVAYARLLMEHQRWDQVRALALELGQTSGTDEDLAGFACFLEGRADLAQHRPRSAVAAAFQRAAAASFDNPAVGLTTAAELNRLGYPVCARDLLLRLQPHCLREPGYWQLLFSVACHLKDGPLVRASARAALELRPENLDAINNYAAALLLGGEQPETALRLTLEVLARRPDSPAARVNHALALALNRRPAEGKQLLDTIDASKLSEPALTRYALACAQACLDLKETGAARRFCQRIDRQYLFPTQIAWLNQTQRELAPR